MSLPPLQVKANCPTYPPYHKGDYMEEYFYKFYLKHKDEFDETGYTFIPIGWTDIYIMESKGTERKRELIQPYLDDLPTANYFTVSQHDDAVSEKLPKGTISFEAGGNQDGIPLPLICSKLPVENTKKEKDILCSFVGSGTGFRWELAKAYMHDKDFSINIKEWSDVVLENQLKFFIEITTRSKFSLCPRGYGAQSFRFYEVLQLNSIPVIVYDKKWLPFEDVIDYESFCVLVPVVRGEIHNLKNKLLEISDDQQEEMLKKGKEIYNKYFTLEGMSKQILQVLKAKTVTPSFDSCMEHSVDYLAHPTKIEDWNIIKHTYNNYITSDKGKEAIPKIIHQIWIGGKMPDQEKRACAAIRQRCEDGAWEYKLWGNDDITGLGNFKNKDLFDRTPNFGQKSDILRNFILHEYGGVYLDTDFILVKLFDELLDLDFFCGLCYNDWPSMVNSILGSKPKSKTIAAMLSYDKELAWHDGMAVIDSTGPWHTTRKALETIDSKTVVFPNSYFYPYPCFEKLRSKGSNPLDYIKPETFCIHLWNSRWM